VRAADAEDAHRGKHRFPTALEIVDLAWDLAQVSPDRDIASVLTVSDY
jgi:hypothetical protein